MASASTVAVVVPSPATSDVLLAASFTSFAPMFSYLSFSSTSSATVTPSLVIVGAPHPLSMTALRPRGPRVAFTARDNLVTPSSKDFRASASKASIFAAMFRSPFERFVRLRQSRYVRTITRQRMKANLQPRRLINNRRAVAHAKRSFLTCRKLRERRRRPTHPRSCRAGRRPLGPAICGRSSSRRARRQDDDRGEAISHVIALPSGKHSVRQTGVLLATRPNCLVNAFAGAAGESGGAADSLTRVAAVRRRRLRHRGVHDLEQPHADARRQ